MVDLGSGDGEVVLHCARNVAGNWKFEGVEYNRWLVYLSRLRARSLRNCSFRVGDLYKYPLGSADVVFICLVPSMLPRLEQQLQSQAKKGTIVISGRFPLPTMKPIEVYGGGPIAGVWVYKT